jgi:hypothetical protein
MEKRGQFFLIAALVIVGLLIGVGTVYNSINAPEEETRAVDVEKAIEFESLRIISSVPSSQVQNNLDDLIMHYSIPGQNIGIVYGNKNTPYALLYSCAKSVSTELGGASTPETCTTEPTNRPILTDGQGAYIEINNQKYYTESSGDTYFFIIVSYESSEGNYVATS